MVYEIIIVDVQSLVVLIILNCLEVLNVLNIQLFGELCDVLEVVDVNDKVWVIVIIGCEKVFVVGVDIIEMVEKSFVEMVNVKFFVIESQCFNNICKFIIVVVFGYVLGGGCEFVMMCDFIIVVENVKFGQFEINFGVIVGMGGIQCLICYVGKVKLMDMYFIGCFMDVVEVEWFGLVFCVVLVKKLKEEVLGVVIKIVEKLQLVVVVVKVCVNQVFEILFEVGLELECQWFYSLFLIEDQKEGMVVFVEKCEL